MITGSDDLAAIIARGGFQRSYVADVIVDGERVLADIPLDRCQLKSNGNARIRTQGTATLSYSDEIGRSVVPTDMTSWLTPYATYLNVSYRVSLGEFSEKILRGTMKVVGVSDPKQTRVRFQDRLISVGSKVNLNVADAFAVTDRERFMVPQSPSSLTSVWAELGVVSGLPLLRNVDDAAIPRTVTYRESRLEALFALAAVLEGVPYVNPAGQLTLQPNEWGDETEPLTIGEDGTITAVSPDNLSDEGIYNQVVVRSHDATTQALVLGHAEVESGPLRYGGPFGRVPYFFSSEFITDEATAQSVAESMLPKVSRLPAAQYTIQCLPDPRREVGDVVPFTYDNETLVGRIQELTLADVGPMTLRVSVERE